MQPEWPTEAYPPVNVTSPPEVRRTRSYSRTRDIQRNVENATDVESAFDDIVRPIRSESSGDNQSSR